MDRKSDLLKPPLLLFSLFSCGIASEQSLKAGITRLCLDLYPRLLKKLIELHPGCLRGMSAGPLAQPFA